MSENRFQAWLRDRKPNDMDNDFVDHARGDGNLPDARSWQELKDYLENHNAVARVIVSAEHVWKQYTNA